MLWSMELYEVASLFGPFLVELKKLRTLRMVFSYFRNPNPTIDIRTELCAIEFVDVIYNTIVYDHHIFFCFSYEEPATVISVSPAIKLTEQWFLGSLCNSVNMSLHQSVCCFICFDQSQAISEPIIPRMLLCGISHCKITGLQVSTNSYYHWTTVWLMVAWQLSGGVSASSVLFSHLGLILCYVLWGIQL